MDIDYTYKVVVVEDEPRILNNIITKIEKANPNFRVIGSTFNGIDALKIINETKPDVLFTDIRMPIMDGLELISEVRKVFPKMNIVILSGYDEFSYAQKALKYGVEEYILKPVETDAISEVMLNIDKKLKKENMKLTKSTIYSIINGDNRIDNIPKYMVTKKYLTILICLGNLCNNIIMDEYSSYFAKIYNGIKWEDITQEIEQEGLNILIFDEALVNEKMLVIFTQEYYKIDVNSIALNIKKKLQLQIELQVSLGVAQNFSSYNNIYENSQNLRKWFHYKFMLGKSQIINIENEDSIDNNIRKTIIDASLEHKILSLIKYGRKETLKKEISDIFSSWEKNELPQQQIEKFISQLLNVFYSECINLSDKKINEVEKKIYSYILFSKNLVSCFEDIWIEIEKLLLMDNKSRDTTEEIVICVDNYIKENFSEAFSIEEMAKKFNFSSAYLTKIFKKYIGDTPSNRLLMIRMEEAKRLLESHEDLDIKDVGEIVGFTDQHYFSRTFKRVTGYSPSDYKKLQS